MKRLKVVILLTLFVFGLSVNSGSDDLVFVQLSSIFHSTVSRSTAANLCELDSGLYQWNGMPFSISNSPCSLNGLWTCKKLHLEPGQNRFVCDDSVISFDGLNKEQALSEINLEPLQFSWPSKDVCKEAYARKWNNQTFIVHRNAIRLRAESDTESFSRECTIAGDILDTKSRTCTNVYLTHVGVICQTGAGSEILRYTQNTSPIDWTRAITNQYSSGAYKFSLNCHPNLIQTRWDSSIAPTMQENMTLNSSRQITSIEEIFNNKRRLHTFDSKGSYSIVNLDRVIESPQRLNTTSAYYRPQIYRPEKNKVNGWVNYLETMRECCGDKNCSKAFEAKDGTPSRLPSQVDLGFPKINPSNAIN